MTDLKELLSYIDPSSLDYQDWLNVGFALNYEGYSVDIWDEWSSKDGARYHKGECERKWKTFNKTATSTVTGGTIYKMALDHGFIPKNTDEGRELDFDDVIFKDSEDYVIVDKGWIEGKEFEEPSDDKWNPVEELSLYLNTLFASDEMVGFVTQTYTTKDGRHLPRRGYFSLTSGQLQKELAKHPGDICMTIGDYDKEAGAWIRFNPLDGKGVKNENVTEFRYALVESDSLDLEKQNAIIRELELPVACLVFSGKKSIHAIVKIEAANYAEYQKRVEYLYKICMKNGLQIDTQNKNPSRLSRMPGVMRNGHKQFIIDTNIGKSSWNEWKEWIESISDDLPEPESLNDYWNNLPELSSPLIEGVLRRGHKMLLAGPSKAGKSFALIELSIAIAEGDSWFGFKCAKGKVLYVNLELDRASCLHRFKDVYEAMKLTPKNLSNIDVWNLRGKSIPMDKLAPKLIRRASKKDYIAVIIDPIYKVITGDENSADQMANFCNQFDKVCTELGCAVIYCHHHSKGIQANKKSMDRASGSGVFARDPDALLDVIELETDDTIKRLSERNELKKFIRDTLSSKYIPFDKSDSVKQLLDKAKAKLDPIDMSVLNLGIDRIKTKVELKSAWRIEGTLREFPKFAPVNLWFDYPIHKIDDTGLLASAEVDGEFTMDKLSKAAKEKAESKKVKQANKFEIEFCNLEEQGPVKLDDMAAALEVSSDIMKRWFGNGSKCRNDLKENFEKYAEGDKAHQVLFLRRKNAN